MEKLKFSKSVTMPWKIMFELYDYIRWSNNHNDPMYADYFMFMNLCEDKLTELGFSQEDIPVVTNQKNHVSRYFYLDGKFDNMQKLKEIPDCQSYKINFVKGKIRVMLKL